MENLLQNKPTSVEYSIQFRSGRNGLSKGSENSVETSGTRPPFNWAQAYLVVCGVLSIAYILLFARRRAPWALGDWLINYEGGFVRRGLPGEVLLLVSRGLHLPLVPLVALLQALLIVCVLICLWPLVARVGQRGSSLWEKALLVSPATLAFVWLAPALTLRKEIAFFALLGVLIQLLRKKDCVSDATLAVFLTVACPVMMLSHEAMVIYMPYLVAALLLAGRGVKRSFWICALPAVLSVIAVAAASRHPGNLDAAVKICNSVGGWDAGLCHGPIMYLALSSALYAHEVRAMVHERGLMLITLVTAVLAILPAVVGLVRVTKRQKRGVRMVLPVVTGLTAVASVALFVQAQDWSRWIYIHLMCLLFLLLFAEERMSAPEVPVERTSKWKAAAVFVGVVLYATTWNLPFVHDRQSWGYFNVLSRFTHHPLDAESIRR